MKQPIFAFDFDAAIEMTTPEIAHAIRIGYESNGYHMSKSRARHLAIEYVSSVDSILESDTDTNWNLNSKSKRAERRKAKSKKEIARRNFSRAMGYDDKELGRYSSHGIDRPETMDTYTLDGHGEYKVHGHRERKSELKFRNDIADAYECEIECDSDEWRWITTDEVQAFADNCARLRAERDNIAEKLRELEEELEHINTELFFEEHVANYAMQQYNKQRGY